MEWSAIRIVGGDQAWCRWRDAVRRMAALRSRMILELVGACLQRAGPRREDAHGHAPGACGCRRPVDSESGRTDRRRSSPWPRAPSPPAGKIRTTVPSKLRVSGEVFRAPSSIDVCPCMAAGGASCRERSRHSRPVASWIGSASMSARRPMGRPASAFFSLMMATTPVRRCPRQPRPRRIRAAFRDETAVSWTSYRKFAGARAGGAAHAVISAAFRRSGFLIGIRSPQAAGSGVRQAREEGGSHRGIAACVEVVFGVVGPFSCRRCRMLTEGAGRARTMWLKSSAQCAGVAAKQDTPLPRHGPRRPRPGAGVFVMVPRVTG